MGIAVPYRRGRSALPNLWIVLFSAVVGTAGYYGLSHSSNVPNAAQTNTRFNLCGYLSRDNCVVDGDTFFLGGAKIRIADIDAPETSGAKCSDEAELGNRATARLRELLNAGEFELRGYRSRDIDRYGRNCGSSSVTAARSATP